MAHNYYDVQIVEILFVLCFSVTQLFLVEISNEHMGVTDEHIFILNEPLINDKHQVLKSRKEKVMGKS